MMLTEAERQVVKWLEIDGNSPQDDIVRALYLKDRSAETVADRDEIEQWACDAIDRYDAQQVHA